MYGIIVMSTPPLTTWHQLVLLYVVVLSYHYYYASQSGLLEVTKNPGISIGWDSPLSLPALNIDHVFVGIASTTTSFNDVSHTYLIQLR